MQTDPCTRRGEEGPDAFAARDALVVEMSTDRVAESVGRLLDLGMRPEAILAEIPTLPPAIVLAARRARAC